MVEIKETSYKDERLGFFGDQRKLVQKRYDRLEKQIKPDEPYTSERREFLSDLGRELSFYNDVIEMLENDVVPNSEVESLQVELDAMRGAANSYKMHYEEAQAEIDRLKDKYECIYQPKAMIKAEAIKEFAERVKSYIDVGHLRPPTEVCFSELDVVRMIERIAQEL